MANAANGWQAWVNVKWKAGAPATAWELWKRNDALKGVWSTQGDWDCALWVDVRTPDELESFVWKEVRSNQWVEGTQTHWARKWL